MDIFNDKEVAQLLYRAAAAIDGLTGDLDTIGRRDLVDELDMAARMFNLRHASGQE